ncbi:hypothetical protein AB6A40_010141 [Gnathostoma spinigerum]|uniref:Insulin-like domain-containing protein n=1 Tax=Gnathostoma spinigerum TaxID=75299 RepID=A0ABD6F1X2_9BILA
MGPMNLFPILVSLCLLSVNGQSSRLCGPKLTRIIDKVCSYEKCGDFIEIPFRIEDKDEEGIVSKCCIKGCSYENIREWCCRRRLRYTSGMESGEISEHDELKHQASPRRRHFLEMVRRRDRPSEGSSDEE